MKFTPLLSLVLSLILIIPVAPVSAEVMDTFDIGVFPRRNIGPTVKMFQPLEAYFAEQLNVPIKLHAYKDYPSFKKALLENQFDLVHLNHYLYFRSLQGNNYKIIAMNEEFGRSTLAGAIFVRTDSNINSIEELRGSNIVFGGSKNAFIAYIVTYHLLEQHGLKAGDYQENIAINPPNALLSAYYHQADAGSAGDIALHMPIVKEHIASDVITMLAKSEAYPHLPWAVRTDLEPELLSKVSRALLGLNDTEQGREILNAMHMTGIVEATDEDYLSSITLINHYLGD